MVRSLTYLGECLEHHELHLGRLVEALQPKRQPDNEQQCFLSVAIESRLIKRRRLSLRKLTDSLSATSAMRLGAR